MIFRKSKKTVREWVHNMDKLITGIIVTGAAASIFGISRTKKGKTFFWNMWNIGMYAGKKGISLFGKTAVKILSFFDKK